MTNCHGYGAGLSDRVLSPIGEGEGDLGRDAASNVDLRPVFARMNRGFEAGRQEA